MAAANLLVPSMATSQMRLAATALLVVAALVAVPTAANSTLYLNCSTVTEVSLSALSDASTLILRDCSGDNTSGILLRVADRGQPLPQNVTVLVTNCRNAFVGIEGDGASAVNGLGVYMDNVSNVLNDTASNTSSPLCQSASAGGAAATCRPLFYMKLLEATRCTLLVAHAQHQIPSATVLLQNARLTQSSVQLSNISAERALDVIVLLQTVEMNATVLLVNTLRTRTIALQALNTRLVNDSQLSLVGVASRLRSTFSTDRNAVLIDDVLIQLCLFESGSSFLLANSSMESNVTIPLGATLSHVLFTDTQLSGGAGVCVSNVSWFCEGESRGRIAAMSVSNCRITGGSGIVVRSVTVRGPVDHTVVLVAKSTMVSTPMDLSNIVLNAEHSSSYVAYVLHLRDATVFDNHSIAVWNCTVTGNLVGLFGINSHSPTPAARVYISRADIIFSRCSVVSAAYNVGIFAASLELRTVLQLHAVALQGHSGLTCAGSTLVGGSGLVLVDSTVAAGFPIYFSVLSSIDSSVRIDHTTLHIPFDLKGNSNAAGCIVVYVWDATNTSVAVRATSFIATGAQGSTGIQDGPAFLVQSMKCLRSSLAVDAHQFGNHTALLQTSGSNTFDNCVVSINASAAATQAAIGSRNLSSNWIGAFIDLVGIQLLNTTICIAMPIGGVTSLVPLNRTDVVAFLNIADCQVLAGSRLTVLGGGPSSPVSWSGAALKATRVQINQGSAFVVHGLHCNATGLALITVTDCTISGLSSFELAEVALSARRPLTVMYGISIQYSTVLSGGRMVVGGADLDGTTTPVTSMIAILYVTVDSQSLLEVVNLTSTVVQLQRGLYVLNLTVGNGATVAVRSCRLNNIVGAGAHLQQVKVHSNSTLCVLADSSIATVPGRWQTASGVSIVASVLDFGTVALLEGATVVGRFHGVVEVERTNVSASNVTMFRRAIVDVSAGGAASCGMCSTASSWVRSHLDCSGANLHTTATDGNESSAFVFNGLSQLQQLTVRVDTMNCTGSQRFLQAANTVAGSSVVVTMHESSVATRGAAAFDLAGTLHAVVIDMTRSNVTSWYEGKTGAAAAGLSCAAGRCGAVVFIHDALIAGSMTLTFDASMVSLAASGIAEGCGMLLHNATVAGGGINISFAASTFLPSVAPADAADGARVSFLYVTLSVRYARLHVVIARAAVVEVAGPTHAIVQGGAPMAGVPSTTHAAVVDVTNSTLIVRPASSSVFVAVGAQALNFAVVLDQSALVGYAQVVSSDPLSLMVGDDPQQLRPCAVDVYCSTAQRHSWSPRSWLAMPQLRYAARLPPVFHEASRDGRTVCPAALQINKLSASPTVTETGSAAARVGNPPPAPVTASVNVVAASSLVGAVGFPTGALATRRLSLLIGLGSCSGEEDLPSADDVVANDIDFMSSPTRLAFGAEHGAIHRGAVVGNLLLWVGCCAAAGAATFTILLFRTWQQRQPRRRVSWRGVVATAATLRLPGLYFIVVALLLQQVLVSSLLLLLYPAAPATPEEGGGATETDWALVDRVVGSVGCVVVCVVIGAIARVLDPRYLKFRALARRVAPCARAGRGTATLRQVLVRLIATSVVWRTRDPEGDGRFVERYGFLFEGCADRRHWWVLVELLTTVVLSVIGSVVPTTRTECLAAVWLGVVVCALVLAAAVWLRPMNNALETTIVYLLSAAQLVVALLGALDVPPVATDAVGIGAAVLSAFLVLVSLGHVLQTHLEVVFARTGLSDLSRPVGVRPLAEPAHKDGILTAAANPIAHPVVAPKELDKLIRAICASRRGSARNVVRFVHS